MRVVRLPRLLEPAALERAMLCAAGAGVLVVEDWPIAPMAGSGPSDMRLAAAQQRSATLADLSAHDDLDEDALAAAGFTIEFSAHLAGRTDRATRSGFEVAAPLWARFEREA